MTSSQSLAKLDLVRGVMMWRFWGRLGLLEIKRRYRRTMIGPLWTALSMAISVTAIGIVFSTLWRMELREFLPYLASGIMVWTFLATIITESGSLFTSMASILNQTPIPYSLFAFMNVWRNLIVFSHNLAVYVVVAFIFQVQVSWVTLLVVPGLVLISVNAVWISLVLGIFSTRYRDIQPAIGSILQILMLVTPIFWSADKVGLHKPLIVDPNPAYHFINIVRAPLLGQAPEMLSWYVVGTIAVVGWLFCFLVFRRYRRWIIFWL